MVALPDNDVSGKSCIFTVQYWVHRGTFDGLYQYYIVPSTDAVEYPEYYQITGDLLNALQRFSDNTRSRLDSCALPSGVLIVEY